MKHCANPDCPTQSMRTPPEFRDEIDRCPRCGRTLETGEAEPPPEEEPLVQWAELARFTYVHEAELAAAHLQSEGIPVNVVDANTIGVHAFLSTALGGVRVRVPIELLERARAILARDERELEVPGAGPFRGGETHPDEACPTCGGPLERIEKRGLAGVLWRMFFGVEPARCPRCP